MLGNEQCIGERDCTTDGVQRKPDDSERLPSEFGDDDVQRPALEFTIERQLPSYARFDTDRLGCCGYR